MDTVDKTARSQMMGRIRGKNTKPELAVRRVAHALGFRFRLHRRDLPGSPDLVFPGKHKVVFVHGCFWHRHAGCRFAYVPKSNIEFWLRKFERNIARDRDAVEALRSEGWDPLIIWECETIDQELIAKRLSEHLASK